MSPLFLSLRPQSPQYCINASFPYNLILPSHFFAEHTYVDNMKILPPLFSLSLHPQIPNPSSFFASPIPDPSPPNIAIMHPLRRSPPISFRPHTFLCKSAQGGYVSIPLFFRNTFSFFLRRRSPLFVTRYHNNASTLVLLTFLFVCNPSSQLFVSNVHYFRSIRHIPFLLSSICQRKVHIMHSDLYFSFAFQTVFLLFPPVFLSCSFNHSFSKEKCTISCIPMHPYSLRSKIFI